MPKPMQRAVSLIAGFCWLMSSVVFGWILAQYIAEGAGLQLFGPRLFPGGIALGLAHAVGLCFASGICFFVGIGLCASGFVPRD